MSTIPSHELLVFKVGFEPTRFWHSLLRRGCLPFHHLNFWCLKRDLNSHGLRLEGLSLLCLPFHHLSTGREKGIRTPVRFYTKPAFKAGCFNHSHTSPLVLRMGVEPIRLSTGSFKPPGSTFPPSEHKKRESLSTFPFSFEKI